MTICLFVSNAHLFNIDIMLSHYVSKCYRPFWNIDIQTNAVIWERPPNLYPQPHPDIEALRAQLVKKLRGCYQEMCLTREGEYHSVLEVFIFQLVFCDKLLKVKMKYCSFVFDSVCCCIDYTQEGIIW